MIVDLAAYDGPAELPCDVCIAGAGAAGLTIALQFIGRREKVVVLEGGGLEYSEESQDIYRGEVIGRDYFPLDASRLRYFGGTTNHWVGYCRPLKPIDFRTRPWVPHSGWPIDEGDLLPYRAKAHEILDAGPPQYDPREIAVPDGFRLIDFDPSLFVHDVWRFSPPTRFGEKYRQAVDEADNVTCLLNASVNDIILSDGLRRAETFQVRGPGEKGLTVKARAFVLALGGLENPRLLLNADRQMPTGIGNQNDLVGRFFIEHLEIESAEVIAGDPERLGDYVRLRQLYDWRSPVGASVSDAVQEHEGILNHNAELNVVDARQVSPGYVSLGALVKGAANGEFADFADKVWEVMTDIGGVSRGVYNRLTGQIDIARAEIMTRAEQVPNPDSRVMLIDEVDRLGLRRIALDWRLTPLDKTTVRTASRLLGREFGRLGIGRLRLPEWLEDDGGEWGARLRGGHHHMGTTRMADDPKQGVVDANCRVHGLDNLYVAGSSVFATSGFATPTLTIVELALRLADHLKASAA